jgi:ABC-type nitrate/sulfonate/bicarbonate transport system substrate-binding protein
MISRHALVRLAAALLVCGACAQAQQPQKITLNFPTRSGASWPMFIAKEGGYLQKYGLDATLVFGAHPAGIAAIISGEAHMTNYSLETALQAGARDGSLIVVGGWLNKAVFALMARKDIGRIQDLKGKRVAITQMGDAPYNYSVALFRKFGMSTRDVEWIPVGTDANGRAAAVVGGRADATLITAPAYYRLEDEGYRNLGNIADHDDIYATTTYLMKRSTIAANPRLPDQLLRAHAEAIKRFYDDKEFAVKAYIAYDKQSPADVSRFYDIYAKGNLFERVPYVYSAAVQTAIDLQPDPQILALLKSFDPHKLVDNSYVERLVKEGFFEKTFGAGIRAEQERKAKLAFR